MKFGSIDTFIELGDWGFRIGRPVANEGFLKALLNYGIYDSYEFFCPDVYHMEVFSKKIKALIEAPELRSRVKYSLQIALSESLQYEDYDIFHLGDFTYFMPYLVDIRNRYTRVPFPVTGITHSLDAVHMNSRYLELVISGLKPYDGIICTSHCAEKSVRKSLARVAMQLGNRSDKDFGMEGKFKRIPLGIDDTFFDEMDRHEARKYFSIPEKLTVALSVGRLSARKKNDWSPVLELLGRMYEKGGLNHMIFIIAGGGEESDIRLMESLISKLGLEQKVILFPNFPPEAKTRLYRASDFYISIVDNFQETFGINIIEAMASGLPVIASDFSGYSELVTHGKDGFLIPTLWSNELPEFLKEDLGILDPSIAKLLLSQTVSVDLENLQKSITTLYNHKDLREKLGGTAKKKAEQYQWRKIIRSYEDFWADLSKEAKKGAHAGTGYDSNLLTGDFQDTFRHYPSKLISDNDVVSLTDLGRDILTGSYRFIKYDDITPCLFPELEKLILDTLSQDDQSIGSIKNRTSEKLQATNGQTAFHLQWLLKHGAIKLSHA